MKKNILTQAIAIALMASPLAASASEAELLKRLNKLAAEVEQLKAELAATKQKTDTVEKRQDALAAAPAAAAVATTAAAAGAAPSGTAVAPMSAVAAMSPAASPATSLGPNTVLSSYGEVNYTRPRKDSSKSQTDVARAVIGITHRFDEKTKMVAEFEWEHAVTSASDKGETEVEQLYVEREFNNGLRAKGGLFLIPAGLLNTNHEPTAYYGVYRNFVETAIIPSTWREAGLGLSQTLDNGLSWDTGLTTGFDLSKWDASSTDGRTSPLGSIHQEGQMAKSHDLSVFGALNWRGVPGLLLGGSVFTGKVGQKTPDFAAQDARLTLWDLHARYTPGKWDLSAVYARGTISNTEVLNQTFAGQPTPVPSSFYGWYTQAAYQLWKNSDYTLTPFTRYERFNTANSYAALPPGLGVASGPNEGVWTVGANFNIGEGVVLKADYRKFKVDTTRDSFDLGLGYAF
ncbi:hypothetical protein SAMN04515617_111104 [Collimonas sp. OK242]|uniref:carbohydrate porin n=1 Tax=Collimonas sp. OK242 TaxID=1798195 RepID=UPI000899492F|nr:carbohydrate porin [Collimonas sp. OK242]SDY21670.1 hypothetical protein SAMN04515617_111104 [Collimonas sp. OK242]